MSDCTDSLLGDSIECETYECQGKCSSFKSGQIMLPTTDGFLRLGTKPWLGSAPRLEIKRLCSPHA